MRAALLLTLAFLLPSTSVWANHACSLSFQKPQVVLEKDEALQSSWDIFEASQSLPVFGRSKRARKKERHHIEEDLKGVEKRIARLRQQKPEYSQILDQWMEFNRYWQGRLKEFESLPAKEQKKYRELMELPLSIGTKHLISFLEAPGHGKWKLGRLHYLLTLHLKHPDVDLKTALFLLDRGTRRFFSRWDFLRCKF